jgi:hypothetical protein
MNGSVAGDFVGDNEIKAGLNHNIHFLKVTWQRKLQYEVDAINGIDPIETKPGGIIVTPQCL